HGGEAPLRYRGDLGGFGLRHLPAGPLAVLEASRPPALDAAAEAFGGHFGVPLVAAVAEVVDAAQVGQHLEAELVAQRAATVVPGVRREHDAHFATRHRHVDLGTLEARAQAIGECRSRLATGFVTGLLSHCAAPSCSRRS